MSKAVRKRDLQKWDDGFYIARSDPQREPKPRAPAPVIKLPERVRLDTARAVAAWKAIGVEVTEKRIREHATQLRAWERRRGKTR
jgi:hypothetical protein